MLKEKNKFILPPQKWLTRCHKSRTFMLIMLIDKWSFYVRYKLNRTNYTLAPKNLSWLSFDWRTHYNQVEKRVWWTIFSFFFNPRRRFKKDKVNCWKSSHKKWEPTCPCIQYMHSGNVHNMPSLHDILKNYNGEEQSLFGPNFKFWKNIKTYLF